MQNDQNATLMTTKRTAWNKGKLTGAKPPLRPKHVWSIRTRLHVEGRTRDLAMFNLAIDSKLRGCSAAKATFADITIRENPEKQRSDYLRSWSLVRYRTEEQGSHAGLAGVRSAIRLPYCRRWRIMAPITLE